MIDERQQRTLTPRLQVRLDQLRASQPLPERLPGGMTLPADPIVVPLRYALRRLA